MTGFTFKAPPTPRTTLVRVPACLLLGIFLVLAVAFSGRQGVAEGHQASASSTRSSQYELDWGVSNSARVCVHVWKWDKCSPNYMESRVGMSGNVRRGRWTNTEYYTKCKAFGYTYCTIADLTESRSGAYLVVGLKLPGTAHIPGWIGKLTNVLCTYVNTACSKGYKAIASARIAFRVEASYRGGAPRCTKQIWFTNPDTGRREQDPERIVSCFRTTSYLLD